jgi:dihydropteroate synthase
MPEPFGVLRARGRDLPLGARTYVMAIVNLTDDSFSGDGVGADLDAAVRLAVAAQQDGADIIDIGGESARAEAPARDAREEAQSVGEAFRRIMREVDCTLSVDSYKPVVAQAALDAGAHIVNDIAGFTTGDATARIAARYGAAYVINYTVERPKIRPSSPPQYNDVVHQHVAFFEQRLRTAADAGLERASIIVDPGIAFGKSHDEDLEILRRLSELRVLGQPVLVAASRKHFIGSVTGAAPTERDGATAAVTALAIAGGADIVRVHDVRANVDAARVADAIVRGRRGDFAATRESWPWATGTRPVPGTRIGEV